MSSGDSSVDNFTGAYTYSYPLELSPGRLGLAPKLALLYNSYRKNGWLGVGWSFDMGSIQRSTKKGLDYTKSGLDAFVYSANGSTVELVPRSDWGTNYYGAKIEGEFTKYYFDATNNKWIVIKRV